MTVYGYARVSTAEQAAEDRTSLGSQRLCILQAAAASELTVDEFLEEAGISGSKPLAERTIGGQLLAQLGKGDTLVIAKLDRGFCNAADALATAEMLKARKVDLVVADMGSESVTQNGVSRMFFGMLALVAEFERERLRERVADGRAAKRRAGGHIGGDAPFGFRKVGMGRTARLEPIPEQQDALRQMRLMRAEGKSLRAIAAELAAQGHRISHVGVQAALWREACAEEREAGRLNVRTILDEAAGPTERQQSHASWEHAYREVNALLGGDPLPPHPMISDGAGQ